MAQEVKEYQDKIKVKCGFFTPKYVEVGGNGGSNLENACDWENYFIQRIDEKTITLTKNSRILFQDGVEEVTINLNGFKLFVGFLAENQTLFIYTDNNSDEKPPTLYNYSLVRNNIDGIDSTYLTLMGEVENKIIFYDKKSNCWEFQDIFIGTL